MVASGEREKTLRIPGFNRHAGIRAVGDRRDGSIAVAFPIPHLQKIADPTGKMLVRRMLLCMRVGESLFFLCRQTNISQAKNDPWMRASAKRF